MMIDNAVDLVEIREITIQVSCSYEHVLRRFSTALHGLQDQATKIFVLLIASFPHRAAQTQIVSNKVPASDFFANTNIVAFTVPPREAETAYAYGDYREFLSVSASVMDAAVRSLKSAAVKKA